MRSSSGEGTGSFDNGRSSYFLTIFSLMLRTTSLQLQQEEGFEAESRLFMREMRNLNILTTASFLINRLLFSLLSRLGKIARLSEKIPHSLMSSGSSGSSLHSSSSSCLGRRFFLEGFWFEAFSRLVMTDSSGGVGSSVEGDGRGNSWILPGRGRPLLLNLTDPPTFSDSEAEGGFDGSVGGRGFLDLIPCF